METNNASTQALSPEHISIAAYHRWLAAGKPAEREQEFWLKAEMDLRKMLSQIPPASPAIVPGAQRDRPNRAFAARGQIPKLP